MAISINTQRVIYNGTDISVIAQDFRAGELDLAYTPGTYFYIASIFPFNNFWIDLQKNANHSPGLPVIQVWWNNTWSNVVDIVDTTNNMWQSGRISWSLHIEKGWNSEQKSIDVGLSGTEIYNKYWMRVSWPAHFDAKIKYIGQKFSDDLALQSYYPDLMQTAILTGFKAGKTDWTEQHFMAAEFILKDLKRRNMMVNRHQVFDWTVFEDAACHKVAEIIYQAFGAPYQDHVAKANKRFNDEMNTRFMIIDSNANGHLEQEEINKKSGYFTR